MAQKDEKQPLSEAQAMALQQFADRHGRTWRRMLIEAWQSGKDERMENGGLLRQVRNYFGPDWLYSTENPIKPTPTSQEMEQRTRSARMKQ